MKKSDMMGIREFVRRILFQKSESYFTSEEKLLRDEYKNHVLLILDYFKKVYQSSLDLFRRS